MVDDARTGEEEAAMELCLLAWCGGGGGGGGGGDMGSLFGCGNATTRVLRSRTLKAAPRREKEKRRRKLCESIASSWTLLYCLRSDCPHSPNQARSKQQTADSKEREKMVIRVCV